RLAYTAKELEEAAKDETLKKDGKKVHAAAESTRERLESFDRAQRALRAGEKEAFQAGKLGVDLAVEANNLRNQSRMTRNAVQRVNNRSCLEYGGVWIDEGFDAKMPIVTVKAMSAAYFRLLEKQPGLRDVFRLGNHLVWVTPSGTALAIDTSAGVETMTDADIDRLFQA